MRLPRISLGVKITRCACAEPDLAIRHISPCRLLSLKWNDKQLRGKLDERATKTMQMRRGEQGEKRRYLDMNKEINRASDIYCTEDNGINRETNDKDIEDGRQGGGSCTQNLPTP